MPWRWERVGSVSGKRSFGIAEIWRKLREDDRTGNTKSLAGHVGSLIFILSRFFFTINPIFVPPHSLSLPCLNSIAVNLFDRKLDARNRRSRHGLLD